VAQKSLSEWSSRPLQPPPNVDLGGHYNGEHGKNMERRFSGVYHNGMVRGELFDHKNGLHVTLHAPNFFNVEYRVSRGL